MADSSPAEPSPIVIRGARTHNLDEVDLDVARGKLTVFCGVSGSGKTSMAIDTLHAEGQRRYIESFSAYTRQFLQQLDKPDADRIEAVPPTIAVTQQSRSRSGRATVATATEVADYLRVFFARLGTVHCMGCDKPLQLQSPESIAGELAKLAEGTKLLVAFADRCPASEEIELWLGELREAGYIRLIAGGEMLAVDDALRDLAAANLQPDSEVLVVIDRLTAGGASSRLQESLETALDAGDQACVVLHESTHGDAAANTTIAGRAWHRFDYQLGLHCGDCNLSAEVPEPRLLDFNSPLGACEACEGFGSVSEVDMELVVPDRGKSIREGAIAPWNTPAYAHELEELLELADEYDLPVDVPYAELTERQKNLIVVGVAARNFGGLNGFFRWLDKRKYKMHLRVFASRWRSYRPCPHCQGARLRPEALAIRIHGANLADIYQQEIRQAIDWIAKLEFDDTVSHAAEQLLGDVAPRLGYLNEVGVGYLTLDRPLRTLSTGESQRVAMTTTLGSSLVDMLYVLDEPTSGLHASDSDRLLTAIRRLRDRGNTIVVVEHDETIITGGDEIVEFGPYAGVEGGQVVFQGSPADLAIADESPTGQWLAGKRVLGSAEKRRPATAGTLKLVGARGNNLQNLTVEFPLSVFAAVTGVSGAGKSTLVQQTLYPAIAQAIHKSDNSKADEPVAPYDQLVGGGQLEDVELIDQSPVARSSRSNPVTYVKAFDPIRAVFAEQSEASARGLTASHFSFNVEGGRCERCQGTGRIEVDMQFLADVTMTCGDCQGQRYKPEVLEVHYRGLTIAEVLEMSAYDAFRFFRGHQKLQGKLKSLLDVGLHYIGLGQAANTLSGGEAQRLKLASHLSAKRKGRTLFLLDEPSTGLHFSDVVKLVDCFDALIDVGHSVLVVDHNVPLLQAADYIIDLGPGAAGEGGNVVAQGTPEQVAKCKQSLTGRVLAKALKRQVDAAKELELD